MPAANEFEGSTELNAGLEAGVTTLSLSQTITFTKYYRLVLPLDGFVFWVRSGLVSQQAAFNACTFNTVAINGASSSDVISDTVTVAGSLHYQTSTNQTEDENLAVNSVVFTALDEVQDLNLVGPNIIYIGEWEGLRFAFSNRKSFYRQAGLFHYAGDAIYPAMATQIIDEVSQIDTNSLIVSNSLPVWLTLNKYMPMYPSFLVEDNIVPPWAAVHIDPGLTKAIQPLPVRMRDTSSHYQLARDVVKITTYGLRNNAILDFMDYVIDFTYTDIIGLVGEPMIVCDEKRGQNELNILAQKKTIIFNVSYYQTRINDIARQLIVSCIPSLTVV